MESYHSRTFFIFSRLSANVVLQQEHPTGALSNFNHFTGDAFVGITAIFDILDVYFQSVPPGFCDLMLLCNFATEALMLAMHSSADNSHEHMFGMDTLPSLVEVELHKFTMYTAQLLCLTLLFTCIFKALLAEKSTLFSPALSLMSHGAAAWAMALHGMIYWLTADLLYIYGWRAKEPSEDEGGMMLVGVRVALITLHYQWLCV